MEEMVYRRHRRKRVRMLDEKRFVIPLPTRAQFIWLVHGMAQAMPGLLLALCDVAQLPSCLCAPYALSLASLGLPVVWPVAGAALALILRLISRLPVYWESVVTLAALLVAPRFLREKHGGILTGAAAIALVPMLLRGWFAPTALETILCWLSFALGTLCTPLMRQAIRALMARDAEGRLLHIDEVADQLCVGLLSLLVMGGGARLLLLGVNAGVLLACLAVMLLAVCFGARTGCTAGLVAGIALSLMGLPLTVAAALSCGGFLCGVMAALDRRWVCISAFSLTCLGTLLMTRTAGTGCGAAVIAAGVMLLLAPRRMVCMCRDALRRFRRDQPESGNAYAASMLAAWERTIDAMALSVPVPTCTEHTPESLAARLCEGCPDLADCGGVGKSGAEAAQAVFSWREAEESVWQGALEGLRGLGCQRLYHLRQSMEALRSEDARERRAVRQAQEQRGMLLTHLTAMAGAARRFASLSRGENWWDAFMAARIRRALTEGDSGARLRWVRRVEGHVQAVFTLSDVTGVRRQGEELCELMAQQTGVRMFLAEADGSCIRLSEEPPLQIECGVCTACITGGEVCGDTASTARLQDGRFMAVLCDGMGHGASAALCSQQSAGLMRLCLDAGYTLSQTLSAVNGMMLLGTTGERFITVDLLIIDLWSGEASLEKLGAASSFLMHEDTLTQITGDALPMGILEGVQAGERVLRLKAGDALLLMTDGVEEAFSDAGALRQAVDDALRHSDVHQGAQSLMEDAREASGGVRGDDQTVMLLRVKAVHAPGTGV